MRSSTIFAAVMLVAAPGAHAAPGDAAAAGSARAPGDAAAARRTLLDGLGSEDRGRIERAVAELSKGTSGAPGGGVAPEAADADVLFAAARACEDKLEDPGRAMALYDRIIGEFPAARVATAAARRAAALRELVGPHGETAGLARELAQLVAGADAGSAEAVMRKAEQLAAANWSGAPRAALWLADWLRRSGKFEDAEARYAAVVRGWPGTVEAREALRGEAGCALDAHAWGRAEELAGRLSTVEPADRSVRDELLDGAARGRRRAWWYAAAWVALAGAFGALLGSLGEAVLRSPPGTRRRALRPPIEVVFLAPVAAVLVGVAFTAHRLIAPAVATISVGGVALAWLSGATLEQLRARGRKHRLRAAGHVALCLVGVAALGYVALTRDSLLDALIETVRFGPDA